MTLDDLERQKQKCTLAEDTFYGAYRNNLNEDRPILSAIRMQVDDSSF